MTRVSAFKGRAESHDAPSRDVPIGDRTYSDGSEFGRAGHGLEVFARGLKLPGRKTPPPTPPAPITPTAASASATLPKWAQEAAEMVRSVASTNVPPTAGPAIAALVTSIKKPLALKQREEAGKAGRATELAIACALGLNVPHFRAAVREGSFPAANFTSERNGETYWNIDVAKQAIAAALAAQTN